MAFSDPTIRSAVRAVFGGGVITEEGIAGIVTLSLDALPESWDELSLLPALETIRVPQEAVVSGEELPEGTYRVELTGGGE